MKITIEGEIDLDQLGVILFAMRGSGKLNPAPLFDKEVEKSTGSTVSQSAAEEVSAGHTETKRVRRTKEQIEADNAKEKTANLAPAPPAAVNGKAADNAVSFEDLKLFAQEKAQDEANVPKIKAKLAEFGVKKTKELEGRPETHNPYYVFLQAL